MRIGEVIGKVTLSRCHPTLQGASWVIAVPMSLDSLRVESAGDGEEVVVFDPLHAGFGDRLAFSEGGEAAAPFYPERKPVDAYGACILDRVHVAEGK